MAVDVIKELFAVLGVKIDQGSVKKADDALEGLTDLTKKLALGIATATVGLFEFTRRFSDSAAETKAWADALGVGTEQLTALDYAASRLTGHSDLARKAMAELGKKAFEVLHNDPKRTSPVAKTLARLGVSITDSRGKLKNSIALFEDLSEALSKSGNRGEVTAAAMQLLGGELGTKLVPMLIAGRQRLRDLGDEAERFGAVVDDESVEAAAGFSRSLSAAWKVITGAGTRVVAKLAPTMERLTNSFMAWVGASRDLLETDLAGALDLLVRILGGVAFAVSRVVHHVTFFADKIGGLKTLLGAFGAIVGLVLLKQLGAAAISIWKLVAGFGALTVAQIAAAVVPILIGAALVALGLIIEDLVTFLQGGKSALGQFLDAIRDWEDYDPSKNPVLWLLQQIVKFLAYIERVGLDTLRSFVGGAFQAAKDMWSFEFGGIMAGAAAVADPWDLSGIRAQRRMEREFVGPMQPDPFWARPANSNPGRAARGVFVQSMTVVANDPEELMSKMPASGGGYSAGDAVP